MGGCTIEDESVDTPDLVPPEKIHSEWQLTPKITTHPLLFLGSRGLDKTAMVPTVVRRLVCC